MKMTATIMTASACLLTASPTFGAFDIVSVDFGNAPFTNARAELTWSGTAFKSMFQPGLLPVDEMSASASYFGAEAAQGIAVGTWGTVGANSPSGPGPIDSDPLTPLGVSSEAEGTSDSAVPSTVDPQFGIRGFVVGIGQGSFGTPSLDSTEPGVLAESIVARIALKREADGSFGRIHTESAALVVGFTSSMLGPNGEAQLVNSVLATTTPSNDNIAIRNGEEITEPLNFFYRLSFRERGIFKVNEGLGPIEEVFVTDVYVEQLEPEITTPAPGGMIALLLGGTAGAQRRR